jgi:hypothetical protein
MICENVSHICRQPCCMMQIGTHVSLVDPHFLPQLATNMSEPTSSIKALRFQATVAQHLDDLSILLALLLERKLALLVVVPGVWCKQWVYEAHRETNSFFPLRLFFPPCCACQQIWRRVEEDIKAGSLAPTAGQNVRATYLSLILRHIGWWL